MISSVVRMTIGTMRIASATLPAKPEKCFCRATTQVQAKTPMTIDGVPLRTSATKRLTVDSRLPGYSEAKTPAPIPTGIPMRQAVPTMSSVPTIAFATPPPLSPAGAGIFVKKSSDRLPAPLSSSGAQDEQQRQHGDEHAGHEHDRS